MLLLLLLRLTTVLTLVLTLIPLTLAIRHGMKNCRPLRHQKLLPLGQCQRHLSAWGPQGVRCQTRRTLLQMAPAPHTAPHTHLMLLPCMKLPHQSVPCLSPSPMLQCQPQIPSQQLKAVRYMLPHQLGGCQMAAPLGMGAL